jgi:hypothetical protein
MEGYLFEKRSEDATSNLFGSGKVYKKRWVELQGHVLQVKDDFSTKATAPVKSKINVLDCVVSKVEEDTSLNMHHVFEIAPDPESKNPYKNTKSYRFAAVDDETLDTWMNALRIEVDRRNERNLTIESLCRVLKMPAPTKEEPVTKEKAKKAYRKLMVSVHPDKGGDEAEFMRVQKAHDSIVKYLEREKSETRTTYDVTIMKTADGIGLNVEEEEATGEIVMKGMSDTCKILEITRQAGGTFKEGDVLQRIDDENVSEWRFSRVKARLSDDRYPTGSKITFQFTRYAVLEDSTVRALGEGEGAPVGTLMNEDGELVFKEDDDDDDDDYNYKNDGNDDDAELAGIGRAAAGGGERRASVRAGTIESVAYDENTVEGKIGMQQQHIRLQHQLTETEELLQAERSEREAMEHDLASVREQVTALAKQLAVSQNSEAYLMEQIRELIVHGIVTSESDATVTLQKILSSGDDVKKGKPVPLSEATAAYVKSAEFEQGLSGSAGGASEAQEKEKLPTSPKFPFGVTAMTDNGGLHNLHTSTRLALAATSAVDPNARVIKRWSAGGTTALDRLLRMEKRLQAIEGEREGYALPGSETATAEAMEREREGADEDKESVGNKDSRPSVHGSAPRRPTAPAPLTGARKSLAEHTGSKGQAIFSSLHAAKKVAEPEKEEKVKDRLSFRDDVHIVRENKLSHMAGGARRRTAHRDSTPIVQEEMQF